MKKAALAALLLAACSREIPIQKQSVVPQPPEKPAAPALNYFEGTHALEAVQQIRAKVGEPFRVLSIRIDPDSVSVEAQDPKKKENVDRYEVEHGVLGASEPVRLVGDTDQKSIEANLFDPATVDLTKVPDLIREANEKIQLEGRTLDDVAIAREMLGENGAIYMDVDYRGTRKNGFYRADKHGAHGKVNIN